MIYPIVYYTVNGLPYVLHKHRGECTRYQGAEHLRLRQIAEDMRDFCYPSTAFLGGNLCTAVHKAAGPFVRAGTTGFFPPGALMRFISHPNEDSVYVVHPQGECGLWVGALDHYVSETKTEYVVCSMPLNPRIVT